MKEEEIQGEREREKEREGKGGKGGKEGRGEGQARKNKGFINLVRSLLEPEEVSEGREGEGRRVFLLFLT